MQRNNAAIAKLLEAEEQGRKRVQEAREQGTLLVRNAKEQAAAEVKNFEAEKRKELDAQRDGNQQQLNQTKKELEGKVATEIDSIQKYAQAHMSEAVDLLIEAVWSV